MASFRAKLAWLSSKSHARPLICTIWGVSFPIVIVLTALVTWAQLPKSLAPQDVPINNIRFVITDQHMVTFVLLFEENGQLKRYPKFTTWDAEKNTIVYDAECGEYSAIIRNADIPSKRQLERHRPKSMC